MVAISSACINKTQTSKQNAFEINRGEFTNRIYAAYNATPIKLTWYYCNNEPVQVSQAFKIRAPLLPLPIRISRALRGENANPSAGVTIQAAGSENSNPNSLLGSKEFAISHTERMTVSDFTDAQTGKNCKPLLADQNLAEATSTSDNKLAMATEKDKSDNRLTGEIIKAVAGCAGLGKDSLIMGGVFAQRNQVEMRSVLGLGVSQVTRGNVGEKLLSLAVGATYCSFGSKGLFETALASTSLTDENQRVFLEFQASVTKRARTLLEVSNWPTELAADEITKLTDVREELAKQESSFNEAASILNNKRSTEQQVLDAHLAQARIFYPIYVAAWNDIEVAKVNQVMSGSEKTMTAFVDGFNGILTRIGNAFAPRKSEK